MSPLAAAANLKLYYETFGNSSNPAMLLISGQGAQAVDWETDFCEELASNGFFVIRYDHRDIGDSTWTDNPIAPDLHAALRGDFSSAVYTLDDLVTDAVQLLNALAIERAHVVGQSMGAMVAQLLALSHPARVLSLALISGTTGASDVGQPRPDVMGSLVRPSGLDREQTIAAGVQASGLWASRRLGVTNEQLRAKIERRVDRGYHPMVGPRQLMAILAAPDRTKALQRLHVPTVVIHGIEDPLVDVSGGRATAAAIPNAELLLIDDMAHDLARAVWPQVIEAVVANAQPDI